MEHAKSFSEIISTTHGRSSSKSSETARCRTPDLIAQNRAAAALRDLGTAAQAHRHTLEEVQEDRLNMGRRNSFALTASRTFLELGKRAVATPTPTEKRDMRQRWTD